MSSQGGDQSAGVASTTTVGAASDADGVPVEENRWAGRPPTEGITWVAFDPKFWRRAVIAALLLFAIFLIGRWVFTSVSGFLFLLLISWLFGIALEPIVGFLARRGMRRGLATGIALITFLLAAALFLAAFGGLLVSQLVQLIEAIPSHRLRGGLGEQNL